MINSMTGFGSAAAEERGIACTVEIRAVNNRFYKAVLKLPDKLMPLEQEVDRILRERLARGSIVLSVAVKDERAGSSVVVNQELLERYLQQIDALRGRLTGVPTSVDLAQLLALPGVCAEGEDAAEYLASHRDMVLKLVTAAADRLNQMRAHEGEALWADLQIHLGCIRERLEKIRAQAPNVARQYHERLRARVLQMVSDSRLSLSDQDLLKEVALFADRADISEEISRLGGHLDQFETVVQKEQQAGRKLDFISQEMLREANTIASKANDAQISKLTVDIKSSVDRIKEQVQNIE